MDSMRMYMLKNTGAAQDSYSRKENILSSVDIQRALVIGKQGFTIHIH